MARGVRRAGQVTTVRTGDEAVDRALNGVGAKVNQLLQGVFAQAVALEVDLIAGLNKIQHPLGVSVSHFAHAALPATGVTLANGQQTNPYPERQVWVRMAGATECKALLFLFPAIG